MWQVLQRALLIVVVGAGMGLLANTVSPKRIPLITPPKKVAKPDDYIPLEKARQLWNEGGAFFLDARKPEDYEAGHIANALNLPAEEFGQYFPKVAPMLSQESPLVVYCNGTECDLSHRLAADLRQQGYTNVHMLFNGWDAWSKAQYPVEKPAAK